MDHTEELDYNFETLMQSEYESSGESSINYDSISSSQGSRLTASTSNNNFHEKIIEDYPFSPSRKELLNLPQGENCFEQSDNQMSPDSKIVDNSKIEKCRISTNWSAAEHIPASNSSHFIDEVIALQEILNSNLTAEPVKDAKNCRLEEKIVLGSFYRQICPKQTKATKNNGKIQRDMIDIGECKLEKKILPGLKKQDLITKIIRGHNKAIQNAKRNYFPTKGISKIRQQGKTFDQSQVEAWKAFSLNYDCNRKSLDEISHFRIKSKNQNAKKGTIDRKSCNSKFCEDYFKNPICISSFQFYISYLFAYTSISTSCSLGTVYSEDCREKLHDFNVIAEDCCKKFKFQCCSGKEHLTLCSEKWLKLQDYLANLSFSSIIRVESVARVISKVCDHQISDQDDLDQFDFQRA